jgi:hypothetical protein
MCWSELASEVMARGRRRRLLRRRLLMRPQQQQVVFVCLHVHCHSSSCWRSRRRGALGLWRIFVCQAAQPTCLDGNSGHRDNSWPPAKDSQLAVSNMLQSQCLQDRTQYTVNYNVKSCSLCAARLKVRAQLVRTLSPQFDRACKQRSHIAFMLSRSLDEAGLKPHC